MSNEDIAGRVVELARSTAPDAEAEVIVSTTALALTRFANSMIHQNVADETTTVRLRLHAAGRTVSSSSTLMSPEDLVGRTVSALRSAPADPKWPGLAPAAPALTSGTVDAAIVEATPDDRARMVKAFVDAAGGLNTAGYCQTRNIAAAFANSVGQQISGATADISFSGIARTGSSDGLGRLAGTRLADIDGATLGDRAARKARAGVDPIELPPGRYEVVLEHAAVFDIVSALAEYAFNGQSYVDGTTFLNPGEMQFDPAITIVDDPVSAGMFGLPFDIEGTPRRRLPLVTEGRSLTPVHDRRTAAQAGADSTGHSSGSSDGPYPTSITLSPSPVGDSAPAATAVEGPAADADVVALTRSVERGLLVTDHWYTRVLDPSTVVMTGLTRNGVWLIEDGEITRPVRNFRFTQSYPQALAAGAVRGIGKQALAQPMSYAVAQFRVPALHLASWNFTGGASG
jgi:predicted Zn-dependent protease